MLIGIDCRSITTPAGIGVYTEQLVRALLDLNTEHRFVLFFDDRYVRASDWRNEKCTVVILPGKVRTGLPILRSHYLLAKIIAKYKLDIFHGPANTFPLTYRGVTVVTAHDLAIYKNPQWFLPGQWWSTRFVVPQSMRRARRVIAVSNTTSRDVQDVFSVPITRIKVVPEGVTISAVDAQLARSVCVSLGVTKPYFFFLGTIEPRKNIPRIVEAFEIFCKKNGEQDLVLAGGRGWRDKPILESIVSSSQSRRIHFLGYITQEQKNALYTGATAFVFPSLYEGFGLPVLEAMASGTPVITGELSATSEVAREAAILVDPYQTEEIAAGMTRLAGNDTLRFDLIQKGKSRAAEFTWEKCASQTLTVYEEAMGK